MVRNLELTYQKYSNVENDGDEPYDPADPDAIYIHPKKSTATSQHSPLCRRLLRTQLQNVSKPKCKFSKRGDDFERPAKNIKLKYDQNLGENSKKDRSNDYTKNKNATKNIKTTTKNLNIKVSKAKLNSNADKINSTKLNQKNSSQVSTSSKIERAKRLSKAIVALNPAEEKQKSKSWWHILEDYERKHLDWDCGLPHIFNMPSSLAELRIPISKF